MELEDKIISSYQRLEKLRNRYVVMTNTINTNKEALDKEMILVFDKISKIFSFMKETKAKF